MEINITAVNLNITEIIILKILMIIQQNLPGLFFLSISNKLKNVTRDLDALFFFSKLGKFIQVYKDFFPIKSNKSNNQTKSN